MIQAIHVAPKARGPWQIPTHVFGTVRASILLMVTMKTRRRHALRCLFSGEI